MELISSGYEPKIFDTFWPRAIQSVNDERRDLIADKKLKAFYNITCRIKNSDRLRDSNTEILHLQFDVNWSTDFTVTEIDYLTGRSLTISLVEANQGRSGNTQLIFSIQHINEKQELFEDRTYEYCATVKGLISKRLQVYKARFDEVVAVKLADYKENGFKVRLRHVVNNFAGYLYYENKKRPKGSKFLSEHCTKGSINRILILFSILNEDCFWHTVSSHNSSLGGAPYYDRSGYLDSIEQVNLVAEQVEDLERCIAIMSTAGVSKMFEKYSSMFKFDYHGFKTEFLALKA